MVENYDDDETNLMQGNDLVSDLYEMIASIETQIHYGDASEIRYDAFKDGFENLFSVDFDKIDDIETIISDQPKMVSIYNDVRDGIVSILDKYLGIKFNYDGINRTVDLQELYTTYKVMYLDVMDWTGKVFAYIIKKNPESFDLKNPNVWIDLVKCEEEFNLDTIPQILALMDPGNADYEFVFGEVPDTLNSDYTAPFQAVTIDFGVFITHFLNELKLGAGIVNTNILLKKIEFYTEFINKNKII